MDQEAATVLRAGPRAVRETTEATKTIARAHVASKLGRRAGYLIATKTYNNAPGDSAGLVYSRWKRRGSGLSGRPADVLAAHTYGAVIEPRNSEFLFIPFRKTRRRKAGPPFEADKVEFIPIGRDRYLIVPRRKRGRGKPIGILVRRVDLRGRLQLDPIYRNAERELRTRLVRYLNADAA